jgi:hypothetical protein
LFCLFSIYLLFIHWLTHFQIHYPYNEQQSNNSELPKDKLEILVQTYKDLVLTQPKVWAHRRIQLDFIDGDDFRASLHAYLKLGLRKGVPSLFSSLKTMYVTAIASPDGAVRAKVSIIEEVVQGYVDALRKGECLEGETTKDAPTVLLWCLYFLARHHDKLGNLVSSMQYVCLCVCIYVTCSYVCMFVCIIESDEP